MSEDNDDLVFIEGGEEDEEQNEDELTKQNEQALNNGLVENKGSKRVPFDSGTYYKEKSQKGGESSDKKK